MKLCHGNRYTEVLSRFILIVPLLLTVFAGPAVANLFTWTLDGVTLTDGGTATGFFTRYTTLFEGGSQNN